MLSVEVKIHHNKPSKSQKAFLRSVKSNGGLAVVAYSLDDATKNIQGIGKVHHSPGDWLLLKKAA